MSRSRHGGLRKRCTCARKNWPKCPHGWHLNFKAKGGPHYRLSLDRELSKHIESKTEAQAVAERIRNEIRDGRFRVKPQRSEQSLPVQSFALEQLGDDYFSRHINPRTNEALSRDERYRWNLMMRTEVEMPVGKVRLGGIPVHAVTRPHLQAFMDEQRNRRTENVTDKKGNTRPGRRGGAISANRCLERLRAFYTWAIDNEYVTTTPFRRGTAASIKLPREFERDRRLNPGEEERLLASAGTHLRALIVAALETGCRVGELLSLQWQQVRWELNEIHLPASKTKARTQRDVPMTPNLRAVLEMQRHDPAGREHLPSAYVFGNDVGERVGRVKRAWKATCRRAEIIGLHFHDLRREAGSRMLEGGVPEHIVQRMLGHANLATTSRYLKTTRRVMHDAMQRFVERRRCTTVAQQPTQPPPASEVSDLPPASKSIQ
jgi:integrase